MKRTPLARKSPLKRKTEIVRGESKRLRRRARRPSTNREAAEAWARGLRGQSCACCGRRPIFGHHVITQQQLRRHARAQGLDLQALLWDERNRLALCEACHLGHHRSMLPTPSGRLRRGLLRQACPGVFDFARELELEWWLEREYPI